MDSRCVQMFMSPGCKGESKTFEVDGDSKYSTPLPKKWELSESISLCGVNWIGKWFLDQISLTVFNFPSTLYLMTGYENFSNNSNFINGTIPEKLSTSLIVSTTAAVPTEGNNNTLPQFVINKSNNEKPSGHAILLITMAIIFVGLLGLAEGVRRYKVHKCNGAGRQLSNDREESL